MLIGVLTLSACGGVPTPAASSQINLSTQPNPPVKGPVQLIVDITDTQGRPLDNAMVLVLASHATMGNMIQQGPAAAQGTGRYVFTADLSGMNGQWLITVQVSKGTLNLAQDFKIDVP
jgi:nitrogen fixation protein FixH